MKKLLSITLSALLMVGALSGCGQKTENKAADGKAKKKIGVSIFSFDNKFQSYLVDAMKAYAGTLQDFTVEFVDAKSDANKQLSQIENFITQGYDAIIVTPVDTDTSKPLTDKAKAAKIPILSVNIPLASTEDTACYIGSDSKQSGIIEMEALAKQVGGKGNVAILMGKMGDEAQRARTDGFKEVLAKYPDMKVVAEATAEWDRAKGMTVMENWISGGKQIDVVAANNDEMAIGASKALEAAGKLDKVKVGGIDATTDALEYLKAGKLAVTVFQDARGQGKSALEAAVKIVKGEKVEKQIMVPYELVEAKDADKYIAKWTK